MRFLVWILILLAAFFGLALAYFLRFVDPQEIEDMSTSYEITGKAIRTIPDATRGGRDLYLTDDIWFYCYPTTGDLILIEKGYLSDFASVPDYAMWFTNQYESRPEPAVIHDWLYAVGEDGKRKYADQIFLYSMKQRKVSAIKRAVMFAAVRLGGANAYGGDKEWNFGPPANPWPESKKPKKPASAVVANIDCATELDETTRQIRLDRDAAIEN